MGTNGLSCTFVKLLPVFVDLGEVEVILEELPGGHGTPAPSVVAPSLSAVTLPPSLFFSLCLSVVLPLHPYYTPSACGFLSW